MSKSSMHRWFHREAVQVFGLSLAQQAVWNHLLDHANTSLHTWSSVRTIATEANMSPNAVTSALDALTGYGFIRPLTPRVARQKVVYGMADEMPFPPSSLAYPTVKDPATRRASVASDGADDLDTGHDPASADSATRRASVAPRATRVAPDGTEVLTRGEITDEDISSLICDRAPDGAVDARPARAYPARHPAAPVLSSQATTTHRR